MATTEIVQMPAAPAPRSHRGSIGKHKAEIAEIKEKAKRALSKAKEHVKANKKRYISVGIGAALGYFQDKLPQPLKIVSKNVNATVIALAVEKFASGQVKEIAGDVATIAGAISAYEYANGMTAGGGGAGGGGAGGHAGGAKIKGDIDGELV